ncbi:O-antigen ligase family protein [Ruminococcus sp.]|uniref:O-antigen ligase family protein n=1 Tax=Ruminococcus sp. TaxID=41978 RepID=UPI0025FD6B58|nr:O-antigen ligase family protein [Ruminococcus sp.]
MSKSIKKNPKTIFHTTEKSNFILNMTEEQYSKLASYGLVIGMFLMPLFTLAPEINDDKFSYAMTAGGLAIAGVINMILAIIAIMKKYITKTAMLPVCAFGGMMAWGVVSLINGYDYGVGFYGFTERGEGLLAILFYGCFFTTAISIKRKSAVKRVINGAIGVGVFNCFIALLQIFGGYLSHYCNIGAISVGDDMKDLYVYAASGLSMSPLFLAMLLTLSLTAAFIGFVTSDSRRNRLIYLASSLLFSFVIMFTYSLIGICGLVFSLVAAVSAVFIRKASKVRLLCVPAAVVFAALAVILVNAGNIGNMDSYKLHDGRILWYADGFKRAGASGNIDSKVIDIDDTIAVYWYLNDTAMDIIGKNKLTGTGPEQLIYPQLKTAAGFDDVRYMIIDKGNRQTFDKVYNEYLYTAATRGIPSLVALLMVLIPVIVSGIKAVRKGKFNELFILFAMTVGGIILFFIGCSSIVYAPVFWAIAGASCADIVDDKLPLSEKVRDEKVASDKKNDNAKKPAKRANVKSGKK